MGVRSDHREGFNESKSQGSTLEAAAVSSHSSVRRLCCAAAGRQSVKAFRDHSCRSTPTANGGILQLADDGCAAVTQSARWRTRQSSRRAPPNLKVHLMHEILVEDRLSYARVRSDEAWCPSFNPRGASESHGAVGLAPGSRRMTVPEKTLMPDRTRISARPQSFCVRPDGKRRQRGRLAPADKRIESQGAGFSSAGDWHWSAIARFAPVSTSIATPAPGLSSAWVKFRRQRSEFPPPPHGFRRQAP